MTADVTEAAKPPIEGMKTMPYGLPLMFDFWFACCLWAATDPDLQVGFMMDTGYSIQRIIKARGIDALIDKSTGYDKTVVVAWCDWVTANVWGEEGKVPEDECDE